ncbi:MAG: prolipoprotein diacylglyceryl transferase [Gemmatimonadaceae bacterium]|nr:prolipoprotein diacylglyceryl transferase [Gemmatimonadaceae bacterium]
MIPYIEQPSVSIGPLTIHAFGAIVAAAVYAGLAIGARRFTGLGLDRALGERLAWWAVVGGFLGAHLFSVLFYFPQKVAANPLLLFKLWEDISSFGSILGGILGIWLFFRLRARSIDTLTRLAYLDVAAFVFPVSLMIGRIACSLAHDHPGTVTDFPLAVSLESAPARSYMEGVYADAGRGAELPPLDVLATLGFHDLGWYEFLFLAATVVPTMLLLDRRSRRPGFFLAAFIVLYMPARFLLDYLRVSDVRYAGLTPAQWGALVVLAVLAVIVTSGRCRVAMPTGGRDGVPTASPADHAPAHAAGRGRA